MIYTAGIFLLNGKDELLVIHPTNAPMRTWSIPKGIIDPNESVLEAAKRELLEETNIDLDKLKLVYVRDGKNVLYATKKKTLCPVYCKVIEGIDQLELKCNSLVEGKTFYENDKIMWMPLRVAVTCIHESQVRAIQNKDSFGSLFDLNPFA